VVGSCEHGDEPSGFYATELGCRYEIVALDVRNDPYSSDRSFDLLRFN
jgi:hypothetical protein